MMSLIARRCACDTAGSLRQCDAFDALDFLFFFQQASKYKQANSSVEFGFGGFVVSPTCITQLIRMQLQNIKAGTAKQVCAGVHVNEYVWG
jgi:hypothetical protein